MVSPKSTLPNDEKQAQDSAYNPGEKAYQEGIGSAGLNAGIDQLEAFANDPKNHDDAGAVRNGEENPKGTPEGGFYKPSPEGKRGGGFSLKGMFTKKTGVIGLIVTVVLGGGIAGVSVLSPAGLFLQLGNTFSNAFDDSAPALSIRANRLLTIKMNGIKNAFEQSSEDKCNLKCKMGTIDEPMKRYLESPSNKFQATFGERKFGGRYTITSITFPDGTITTTGEEFAQALKDPARARDFSKIFNSKIKFFLHGSRFGSILRTKLGLDRLTKAAGDTKDKINESLRKAVGLSGKSAADDDGASVKARADEINSKASLKGSKKVTDIVGLACAGYDVAKVSVSATKIAKMAAFGAFALTFLAVQDEIMRGDADGAVVGQLGAQLTDGSSATDSQIFKQAQYGDDLTSDSKFSLAPSGALVGSLSFLTALVGANTTSRIVAHGACTVGGAGALAVACGPAFVAGLPVAVVGSVVTLAACLAGNVAAGAVAGGLFALLLPGLIDLIVKSDLILPDETTRGMEAGQVIGLGAKNILIGKSQGYGLSAATSPAEIAQYNSSTSEYHEQQRAIARLEAQENPLDVNNQYTFVGSLASKLDLMSLSGASFNTVLSKTLAILPKSLAAITPTTSAAAAYPLGYDKSKLYMAGNNAALDNIGVMSDRNGMETYVMASDELNADTFATIDALIASGDIDEDGNILPGSDFEKYEKYCGIGRVDALGESSGSISDSDFEWQIGAECVKDTPRMKHIRVMTMDMAINDTIDEKGDVFVDTEAATETAVLPVPADYKVTDYFGPRVAPCPTCSSNHPGIDFSNFPGGTLGKPVYSVMSGEVIAVNRNGGNNPVSIKHADGTVAQYLHMYTNDILVNTGDKVTAGQQIGKIGDSGDSTGPHLDIRIYIDSVDLDKYPDIANIANTAANIIKASGNTYINPIPYLKLYGLDIK